VLMNLDGESAGEKQEDLLTLPDRWILARMGQVSRDVSSALEDYRFNDAAGSCYQFVWHEFCDWYLEMAKLGLYNDDESVKENTKAVLAAVLKAVLKLLHPFMPFVTEEVWQLLPGNDTSIMVADFPEASADGIDQKAIDDMDLIMGVITGIRNIRGEMRIPPSKLVNVVLDVPDKEREQVLMENVAHIRTLGKVEGFSIVSRAPKPEGSATAVFQDMQIHVLLKGLLDFEEEKKRINKEIMKLEKDLGLSTESLQMQISWKRPHPILLNKSGKRLRP